MGKRDHVIAFAGGTGIVDSEWTKPVVKTGFLFVASLVRNVAI